MHSSIVTASICILALLMIESVHEVNSTPVKYSRWEDYQEATGRKYTDNKDNKCLQGGAIRDLCEKCTKFTKSEVVFPLCCEGRENVRPWCKNFLEYTPAE
ncbi:hypothetical protein X975_16310, partial [Stegodyphus mimosarum]